MQVGLVGINHKLADLRLRELLAKACERGFGIGRWRVGDHAFVLLSTCNRTEIYFSASDLAETHSYILSMLRAEVAEDFEQKLYSYFGSDCFLHLARVTSGLDSALVGETEIQGQVKSAYESARSHVILPPELHFLFQKSLKIAKGVRSQFALGKGMPDVPHAIWSAGVTLFDDVLKARVLFVGASEINGKICQFLKSRGLTSISLCNRSAPGAEMFAMDHGLEAIGWDRLDRWMEYDWVILGTKCPHYLITKESIPQHDCGKKLIIDLSVPRNVDPRVGRDNRFTLLNIDQIHHAVNRQRRQLHDTLLLAEMRLATEIGKQMELRAKKEGSKLRVLAVSA